ncbi:hypothetical protein ZHAS_00018282 [Anopheles sinensis]|uniref:Uncharacterized protein n=1 Tax=Anopheles sinensis TaxID=74873 RepID=A0A084WJ19_ANOSI|nr:hypothetical protein ZHAS_00018282 [Anopheles sinensis]
MWGYENHPLHERTQTVKIIESGGRARNNNNNINVTDEPRRKRDVATRPNHILLFTILNPIYPITVLVGNCDPFLLLRSSLDYGGVSFFPEVWWELNGGDPSDAFKVHRM